MFRGLLFTIVLIGVLSCGDSSAQEDHVFKLGQDSTEVARLLDSMGFDWHDDARRWHGSEYLGVFNVIGVRFDSARRLKSFEGSFWSKDSSEVSSYYQSLSDRLNRKFGGHDTLDLYRSRYSNESQFEESKHWRRKEERLVLSFSSNEPPGNFSVNLLVRRPYP
jgi:hypothetical protein